MGPVATPVLPEDLTGSRREVLVALDAATRLQTVEDLATALTLHPNSVRGALTWLADLGLVVREVAPAVGRGRPGHLYAATVAGRAMLAVARAGGGGEYRGLAEAFAHRLADHPDAQQEAHTVGKIWGRQVVAGQRSAARGVRAVRRRVVRLLTDLGFGPEPVESDGATLVLRTCPLLASAMENPDVICSVHAGMVAGASEALGGSADGVDLHPFSEPAGCRLTLS